MYSNFGASLPLHVVFMYRNKKAIFVACLAQNSLINVVSLTCT